jgi:hypothetical protein
MPSSPIGGNRPVAQPAQPQHSGPVQQQEKAKSVPGGGDGLAMARPTLVTLTPAALPQAAAAFQHNVETQAMIDVNESLIHDFATKISKSLEAKGIDASSVGFLYNIDVTGHEVQVCLACGQIGHDYMPTMVRMENPEINMLSESIAVSFEVARRVGMQFGVLAHDESVLPLREISPPGMGTSLDTVLARFKTFKLRHDNKDVQDGTQLDWMRQEMDKWDPSWAERTVVGKPADTLAVETGVKLFNKAGVVNKNMVMVKGQPSQEGSLKGLGARAKGQGVELWGVAVGAKPVPIKKTMFKNTASATDMHQLRGLLLQSMLGQIDSAAGAAQKAG